MSEILATSLAIVFIGLQTAVALAVSFRNREVLMRLDRILACHLESHGYKRCKDEAEMLAQRKWLKEKFSEHEGSK